MNRKMTLGVMFIFGSAAGWLAAKQEWNLFLTSYIPSFATLVAAYYGAKFAFQFQTNKDKDEKDSLNILNGNSTLFTLMQMGQNLKDIQNQQINPLRDNSLRYIKIPPSINLDFNDYPLHFEQLFFLLQTEDWQLLEEARLAVERYRCTLDAINLRSERYLNEVLPQLKRSGFVNGNVYADSDIENMLGPDIKDSIIKSTDQSISLIDTTVTRLQSIGTKLTASLKRQFPQARVIKFEFKDKVTMI